MSGYRWTTSDLDAIRGRIAANPETAKAARVKRRHPEDDLQRAIVELWSLQWPDTWRATIHVPAGMAAKNPKLAGIFRGLGFKAGFPDLACFAPRGPWNGLALELKWADNVTSESQNGWLAILACAGWRVAVVRSFEDARALLESYHAA